MNRREFIAALGVRRRGRWWRGRNRNFSELDLALRARPQGLDVLGGFCKSSAGVGLDRRKKLRLQHRFANDRPDRLPELATELVALNVDMIVTIGTSAPLAAKRVTSTIPIIVTAAGDPLGSGLVASLHGQEKTSPGSAWWSDLGGQRVELVERCFPALACCRSLELDSTPSRPTPLSRRRAPSMIQGKYSITRS